jgi:hypothetical protein
LRAFVFDLTLIDDAAFARRAQQLFTRVDGARAQNQDHVLVQDGRHRFGVVTLDRRLVGRVESRHGAAVVVGIREGGRHHQRECQGGGDRRFVAVHGCSLRMTGNR